MTVSAPEPLDAKHRIDDFDCGSQSLNDWLRKHALRNQASGASRTFVVRDGERVIAYYALASSAIALDTATGKLRRNMPDPVPVVVLGRLAVDVAYQGQSLGRALLQDAGRRVLHAADEIGIRGLLVHALDETAKAFCVFQAKAATDSTARRPLIPFEGGHRFHGKATADSKRRRPPVPVTVTTAD